MLKESSPSHSFLTANHPCPFSSVYTGPSMEMFEMHSHNYSIALQHFLPT